MSDTTVSDLSSLHIEENRQELALLLQPLIQQAVAASIPQELLEAVASLNQAREDLASAQAEIEAVKATYITAEQAEQNLQKFAERVSNPLKDQLSQHLTDWNKEDERRHQAYIQRLADMDQRVQQNIERVTETEKKLAASEASTAQKLEQIERRLARTETDIDKNVKKVADSAQTMNMTFSKFLHDYEAQAKENARNIEDLLNARNRFDKRLAEQFDDTANLRGDVDGLRADIATKVTTTDLKVKHIDSELSDIKQRLSNQDAEQALLKKWVIDIQVQTKAAFWLLNTIPGRAVLLTVLALLGISNLVS